MPSENVSKFQGLLDEKTEPKNITTTALFDRKKISRDKSYEGHLMISLKAEDPDFKRTPVCVVLVLDTSTSMGPSSWGGGVVSADGKTKLDLLKSTARKIVQNLTEDDQIAIVSYNSISEVVLKRTNCGNKGHILNSIDALQPTGSTNMSAGLFDGFSQVDESFNGVVRLMLLSDGLPNQGVTGSKELIKIMKTCDSKATVSTFGFGTNADQDLLADMAKAGAGNYYFIDSEDIQDIFARELGGLVSCLAQNIEVEVNPSSSNKVVEILNDYTVVDEKGVALIKAEDIYAEETKHILIKMKIAKPNGHAKDRPKTLANLTISYEDLKSGKREIVKLKPKIEFVKASEADKETNLEVAEQVSLMEASRAQLQAVEEAKKGNFTSAQDIMAVASMGLHNLSDRGSQVATLYAEDHDTQTGSFMAGVYDTKFGSQISTSAMGLMKHRGTSGLSANLYGNTCQADMIKNFATDDPEPDVKVELTGVSPDVGNDLTNVTTGGTIEGVNVWENDGGQWINPSIIGSPPKKYGPLKPTVIPDWMINPPAPIDTTPVDEPVKPDPKKKKKKKKKKSFDKKRRNK